MFGVFFSAFGADSGRTELPGHVPPFASRLVAKGRPAPTNEISLALGLPLPNGAALDEFIRELYDPGSANFHKFITPPEFAARFGPAEADYQNLVAFARTNALSVEETFTNRLVLAVTGRVSDIERAFQVTLRTYRHPTEARDFYAPDREPSVPAGLRLLSIEGLDDFSRPRHTGLKVNAAKSRPLAFNGTGPGGEYAGMDFRNAYVPGSTLNGAGQTVAVLEYSGFYGVDITNYENIIGAVIGATNYVPLTITLVSGSTPSTADNDEVALDIEMAISMAPMLSRVMVYEKNSVNSSLLNKIATDNLAKQVSSSWLVGSWSASTANTYDNILKNMASQGQSYFQSAGDSDAYTGSQSLDSGTTVPADSPYATIVGGTTLAMNGAAASYNSETVWNYNLNGIPNEGSGGGISSYYTPPPTWQTNISMTNNNGSTTFRNIPDVAFTADDIFVSYDNGDDTGADYFMGTSAAAPLWAGFTALINQQSEAVNGTTVGFLNPALYALAGTTNYTNVFHDITTGNNVGSNTPGLYNAVAGYDLATGLGTPNGTNLINALVPPTYPRFLTQPPGLAVTNGANVSFNAAVVGAEPLNFQWLFNGTNLPAGGNISGVASNGLSITPATTNNAGNYSLVLSNSYGSITSSVALLNVGFTPTVLTSPTNLTLLSGGTAIFTAAANGTLPLNFQWKQGVTNLVNGAGIAGATTNVLTLTGITTNSTGSYALAITNLFGAVNSSAATLTVVLPPGISSSSLTNRTLQCGSNVSYSITTNGTGPLGIQWSLDGVSIPLATNASFTVTNVHMPNHAVSVVVTNLYASLASNATLTVIDTLPPVITLNGANRMTNELGSMFTDPGATANDLCAGPVPVATNGVVNTAVVGTNLLTYTATDGNGNTNTAMRTVVVRDTTPPVISWSFTNLTVVANASCSALMTNVTGTNFIIASDLSGTVIITQSPTNNAPLPLGTNLVLITVADPSGNKSFSTNHIILVDQTPPSITLIGGSVLTNQLGSAFVDPGVFANDTCAGNVAVVTNGVVNINAVGSNALSYVATDASGNTNSVIRSVIVVDTTPPTISWSFTNLVVAAGPGCSALMTNVTGTNFILATDLSEPLTISQTPTNGTVLFIGTNVVVIAVSDIYSNTAFSTNQVIVQDQTPPDILSQPLSLTNNADTTAVFSVSATACTPLGYQWFINGAVLTNQTGSLLTLSNLVAANAGNYYVVATAGGGSSTSVVASLTVNLFPTALALSSTADPDGFKSNLNFTAIVTPTNATGAVQFYTNGAAFDLEPLIAGTATSTNVSILPRGTNLIAAIYGGDANSLPATNMLVQIVTNHPPQVQPAFYTLVAGLNLNFLIANLATNWSDVDGDALTLAYVSPSTNGVIVTVGASTLTYSNASYVNDQFTCTISDGFGGTNFEAVNITVVPQTNSTPGIAGTASTAAGFNLTLYGGYGSTYVLQSTTNIISGNWQPVATNTPGVTGVWQFTDPQATNSVLKFYRLELVQ